MGILSGVIPQISGKYINFTATALAQNFSQELLRNYAAAVLKIEPLREQAYNDIQQIIGSEPPEIVCSKENTLSNLPPDAQEIAKQYCSSSKQIVESSGLSVSQFNDITQSAATDNNLKTQIQEAIREIQ